MPKAAGSPVFVSAEGSCRRLERVYLGAGFKDEGWLQALIFEAPELLPIARIERGIGTPIPAAREVSCGHGSIDNLYLTPTGEIILVETKLWRNLQARREVVAQALDYVSALMKLGYEGLERAVLAAVLSAPAGSLHALVSEHPEALNEAEFIDAVSRNLARGRLLVIVLGDGIREEAEALVAMLQSHPGAHFTFALVELATWQNPQTGDLLVLPNTLAQTVMIERGILRFEGRQPLIEPPVSTAETRPKTMSEELFFEDLGKRDPQMPVAIRTFLERVEPLGVRPDFLASLNLKAELPFHSRPTNFGYITKTGKFWTDPLSWTVPREVAIGYNGALKALIGGTIVETPTGTMSLTTNGSSGPLISALLPTHADGWYAAIAEVIHSARVAEPEASS